MIQLFDIKRIEPFEFEQFESKTISIMPDHPPTNATGQARQSTPKKSNKKVSVHFCSLCKIQKM